MLDSKLLPIVGRLVQAVMVLDSISNQRIAIEYSQEMIEIRMFIFSENSSRTIFRRRIYVSGELLSFKHHANPEKKIIELINLIEYITELEVDSLAENGAASPSLRAASDALEADDVS